LESTNNPNSQLQEFSTIQFGSAPRDDNGTQQNLVAARPVPRDKTLLDALPVSSGDCLLNRRQIIVGAALVLVLTGAVVGGVCGLSSGRCGSSSAASEDPLMMEAAATVSPQPSHPTMAPTIGSESTATIEVINSVTHLDQPLTYPHQIDERTTSPEQLALRWLLQDDPRQPNATTSRRQLIMTRYALATLWFSLGGNGWFNTEGWLTEKDCGEWFGVSCIDPETVYSLELGGIGLSGQIPRDLALLGGSLNSVGFSDNPKLTGTLPAAIGSSLVNAKALDINNCALSGKLPETMGQMTNLSALFLSDNNLSGAIPESAANWTLIRELWLGKNRFSGPLPEFVAQNWQSMYQFSLKKKKQFLRFSSQRNLHLDPHNLFRHWDQQFLWSSTKY